MGKTAAMAAYAYPGAVPPTDPTAVQGRRIGAFFIDAAIVTVIAIVLVGPALVLLYRLDTMGELEPLTDADTRAARTPGDNL